MNITHRDVSVDIAMEELSVNRKIGAIVANDADKTVMEAIRKYAKENGIDEILVIPEDKLLTIFKLGVEAYETIEARVNVEIEHLIKKRRKEDEKLFFCSQSYRVFKYKNY